MSTARSRLGADGEAAAADFLRRQRYEILARNYRCPVGEVDLIALDHGTLVFIEVKTRAQSEFGSPFEAVDTRKQARIERAAVHYMTRHRLHGRDARFDVVGVRWDAERAHCDLVRNAFTAQRW